MSSPSESYKGLLLFASLPTPWNWEVHMSRGVLHTMTTILRQARLDPEALRFLPLSPAALPSPQANCSLAPRLPAAPGMVPPRSSTWNPRGKDETDPGDLEAGAGGPGFQD